MQLTEVEIVMRVKRDPNDTAFATEPVYDAFTTGWFSVDDDQRGQLTAEINDVKDDYEMPT